MRFLFFAGGWIMGGMETAFLSLMTGLLARGHRPTAIVSAWTDGDMPRLLDQAGIPHHEVALGRFYVRNPVFTWHTLRHMPAARRQLRAIAADVRPDWVVSPDAQTLLLSASILRVRRALFLHSQPDRLMRHSLARGLVDRNVDRIICCSRFIADCARRTTVDAAKLAIVPNGVPLPVGRRSVDRQTDGRPVRLGIVGRVVEQKQHHVLLEACASLQRQLPDAFHLDIVGTKDGPFAEKLERLIADSGLAGIVRWTGFIADRERLYGDLDIVAAPAIDEPFGLTVPEAASYGLPVVAARSGAFPELIEDGRTGLLFAAGDPLALADVLGRLIRDASLRKRLGEAARAHVATRFTVAEMTDRFLDATSR